MSLERKLSGKSITVELIHPPHPEASEDRLDAPLGLLYIAANLEKNGYQVCVNDLSGIKKSDWKIGLADVYGIAMYAPTMDISEEIARKCKEINPSSKTVAGGAHPTAIPSEIRSIFDSVIVGEGEAAMVDLVNDFPNIRPQYKRPLDRNLDLYPNAAYHLVDLKSYKRTFSGEQAITLLTSRGCPFRCSFCGLAEHHKTVKRRSPERVVEEIREIQKKYDIHKFNFQDDTFTVDKKRLHNMLDLFEPQGIGFRAHGRAGIDTPEDYIHLKKAGCEVIAWGIESGSQKMLSLMNKQATVEQNANVIQWARDAGITTRAFFVFGFPGETRETMEETKAFIEKTNPDQYFVSNFVPYPNTDVWNNPKKYGVIHINKDFSKYYQVNQSGFGSRNIVTEDLSTEEFLKLEKEFRMWISQRDQKGDVLEYQKKLDKKMRGNRS